MHPMNRCCGYLNLLNSRYGYVRHRSIDLRIAAGNTVDEDIREFESLRVMRQIHPSYLYLSCSPEFYKDVSYDVGSVDNDCRRRHLQLVAVDVLDFLNQD